MESAPTFRPLNYTGLIVYPKDPPKAVLGNFDGKATQKKPPQCGANTAILDSHMQEGHFQMSATGKIPGMYTSTGFINTTTAAKAAQGQTIDEDTLDAWNQSRMAVAELQRRRQEILSGKFVTEEPTTWETTAQREHKNFLPVGTRAAADTSFKDAQVRGKGKSSQNAGSKGTDQADIDADASSVFTSTYKQRDNDMEFGKLKQLNDTQQRNFMSVEVSRNGTTARKEVAVVVDRPRPGLVGGKLTTTNNTTIGNFDKEFYADTTLFPSLQVTTDEDEYIAAKMNAKKNKYHGMYCTTTSDNFTDKTGQAQVEKAFAKSHFFEKKGGTTQMPKRGNDPILKGNNFQRTQRSTDVVPDHFMTTSMKMNSHFNLTN